MGRFGSPFASLDYYAVDPHLAEFDSKATPLEQFLELVDAVHARNGRIFIDIPVNHTGWASRLHLEHPEWFVREEDRSFVSPGAWGVVWADLCKLDYRRDEVHKLMADVFLYWCRRGVDGFRCDAGYMLPLDAWRYIIAKVRNEYPDAIFLLEGLGGPPDTQEKLLADAGLNWAYSEIFQNYTREQIENYLPYAERMSQDKGLFVNFAETHDNNRLAAKSRKYSRMRTALCALLSHNGAFGITNGVEWFAEGKVDVHGAESLNWGASENQVAEIRTIQILMEWHPAFHAGAHTRLIEHGHEHAVALLRESPDRKKAVLALINLDERRSAEISWKTEDFIGNSNCVDLLSGKKAEFKIQNELQSFELEPAQAVCLSNDIEDLEIFREALSIKIAEPVKVLKQRMRLAAMETMAFCRGYGDLKDYDPEQMAQKLIMDPMAFCSEMSECDLPPVTEWEDGYDQHRTVMLPSESLLFIRCRSAFRAEIKKGEETERYGRSIPLKHGGHFLIFNGFKSKSAKAEPLQLKLTVFDRGKVSYTNGRLLLLADADKVYFRRAFSHDEVRKYDFYALCSNKLGGMSQVRADWGTIRSKYDAVLAANCNPDYPVDRRVMFTRCRGWLVCSGYSQEVNLSCLERFVSGNRNCAEWEFRVPAGQGKVVPLTLTLSMALDCNVVKLSFKRKPASADSDTALAENIPVRVILRPDIEDRCNHEVTHAFTGPEKSFPHAVTYLSNGFSFKPGRDRCLRLSLEGSVFVPQPEWKYMQGLPVERERGLEDHTDMFSPGYFEFKMRGDEEYTLLAAVAAGDLEAASLPEHCKWPETKLSGAQAPESAMYHAMERFIVKRDRYHTVIAGYPWFLDWGRDTLICLRGMIAAGYLEQSREIILQFAEFEKQGTIPNMIRGKDDSNRDTSDAPLWLFVAVSDYCREVGKDDILNVDCGGRTLFAVLKSIAENYQAGTPNGIKMDDESGLVFSPSHFTWMDTNYPAGTPRQGYPVEIQALWYAALEFLAMHEDKYVLLRDKVKRSIEELYFLEKEKYYSDCLHAEPGMSAKRATPDDACRCNQLLAVTLNAVTKREHKLGIVKSCQQLLVPGAIRSLADRKTKYPLPVYHHGKLLNNPHAPYWGRYYGDEDTRRKPAYHNGTAWTWPFPSYSEALLLVGGEKCRKRAKAVLMSCQGIVESGTPEQVPEILDGNIPHTWRGCGAQAWGITELYRVFRFLNNGKKIVR
jgi:predicted glycogen debranching enzyme